MAAAACYRRFRRRLGGAAKAKAWFGQQHGVVQVLATRMHVRMQPQQLPRQREILRCHLQLGVPLRSEGHVEHLIATGRRSPKTKSSRVAPQGKPGAVQPNTRRVPGTRSYVHTSKSDPAQPRRVAARHLTLARGHGRHYRSLARRIGGLSPHTARADRVVFAVRGASCCIMHALCTSYAAGYPGFRRLSSVASGIAFESSTVVPRRREG